MNQKNSDEECLLSFKFRQKRIEQQGEEIKTLSDVGSVYRDEDGNPVTATTIFVSATNFHKVFLRDLAKVLELIGNSETKVFAYILLNTNYNNIPASQTNVFAGTYKDIAKETGTSDKTVMRVIKKLLSLQCLNKIGASTYRLNPSLISIGKVYQQQTAVMQFNDELIVNLKEDAIQRKSGQGSEEGDTGNEISEDNE